jgi:hypothetical protein
MNDGCVELVEEVLHALVQTAATDSGGDGAGRGPTTNWVIIQAASSRAVEEYTRREGGISKARRKTETFERQATEVEKDSSSTWIVTVEMTG